jgi:hypothetical protein
MAALTANKVRRIRNAHKMLKGRGVAADSSEFFVGAMLAHNNAGRIARGADTASFKAAGVCNQRLSTGASNTLLVEFEWGHEEWFPINGSDVGNAGIGLDPTIFDDQLVSNLATTTNDVRFGRSTELETIAGVSGVWIEVVNYGTAGVA